MYSKAHYSDIGEILGLPSSDLHKLQIKLVANQQVGEKDYNCIPIAYLLSCISDELNLRKDNKRSFTLEELLEYKFPPLEWLVENLVASGLTLLWGAPKSGKSIFALNLCLAVSNGLNVLGTFETKKASVLMISLEDGERRLQTRFRQAGATPNKNLIIFCDWHRGEKGYEELAKYLDDNPEIKLVIIDTLFLFCQINDMHNYSLTAAATAKLKKIADSRDIAIIAIHHAKKKGNENTNFLESALGSTGLVGGPDHLQCLELTPGSQSDAVLHFVSKDSKNAELALKFAPDICGWKYIGDTSDLGDSNEQQEILDLLKTENKAMKTGEIASRLGKRIQAVSNLLSKMNKKKKIEKISPGIYRLPSHPQCNQCNDVSSENELMDSYTDTPLTPPLGEQDSDTRPIIIPLELSNNETRSQIDA